MTVEMVKSIHWWWQWLYIILYVVTLLQLVINVRIMLEPNYHERAHLKLICILVCICNLCHVAIVILVCVEGYQNNLASSIWSPCIQNWSQPSLGVLHWSFLQGQQVPFRLVQIEWPWRRHGTYMCCYFLSVAVCIHSYICMHACMYIG